MTEAEFETTYRQTLLAIEDLVESAIETDDVEIDYETINDILNLEFEDGSAVILTKQGATQQLWVAAVSGGFHFKYANDQWQSTLGQESLANKLKEVCLLQGGVEINFSEVI